MLKSGAIVDLPWHVKDKRLLERGSHGGAMTDKTGLQPVFPLETKGLQQAFDTLFCFMPCFAECKTSKCSSATAASFPFGYRPSPSSWIFEIKVLR